MPFLLSKINVELWEKLWTIPASEHTTHLSDIVLDIWHLLFFTLHCCSIVNCGSSGKFMSPQWCMPCELNQKFFQCSPIVRNSCRFSSSRCRCSNFYGWSKVEKHFSSINFMMKMDEDVFSSFHLLFFFYQNETDVLTTAWQPFL